MNDEQYGVGKRSLENMVAAPELPYLPRDPKEYNPGIGLIGCGGISEYHLREYQKAGYRVLALCDEIEDRAQKRREEFFPKAEVVTDYRRILERDDIEVIDAATHPSERVAILHEAISAKKHILSQKPFVENLDDGERLVAAAREAGVKFAVNQNGRWSPHFCYMRRALEQGLLGDVTSVHFSMGFDHSWTAETPFNEIKHLVLYDFAIHWFDMMCCFMEGKTATRVFASIAKTPTQKPAPPMLAHAAIEFDGGLGTISLNGDVQTGLEDRSYVMGTKGSAMSVGPDLLQQTVTLHLDSGVSSPALEGNWFSNGFHGTMGELLCAIEEGREPEHAASHNLPSLALCFAAVASAESGQPQTPGEVRKMP
ncbi:MAG: Gfo/Idh/MocA family oxidoreductase [Candidatus Hinthialibacter antarcticus]|nr:Gfo/Idh/MocA family oxidoreductase [Candidatus Hinthialibacter antarcticus]